MDKGSNKEAMYWQDLAELRAGFAGTEDEFSSPIEASGGWDSSNRRDFLKWMGFSVGAAALAACETPVRHAIPYLNKPVDVNPGLPNYYASTYANNGGYGSVLVKTREGRPIKLSPNPDGLYSAGTSAQIEASVLDLYDEARLRGPKQSGQPISWDTLDKGVQAQLAAIADRSGRIVLVSHSIISPSTRRAIALMQERYPTLEHLIYDNPSYAGALDANLADFGLRALPMYDFSRADCIVSIGADFLGTWIHPHLFAQQFAQGRSLHANKKDMSRLYVLEAGLSLTGTQADHRYPIRASAYVAYLAQLYQVLTQNSSLPKLQQTAPVANPELVKSLAEALSAAKGKALVVCGLNDQVAQRLCNAINYVLGSYAPTGTISWAQPVQLKQGRDQAMDAFVKDLAIQKGNRSIEGVLFYNCNPVYDHRLGKEIAGALSTRPLTLSTADRMDETAQCVEYVAPDHHYLESWNDHEPATGLFSFSQPAIRPLFDTRQAQSSFLHWADHTPSDYLAFLKAEWARRHTGSEPFQVFWDRCLYKGSYRTASQETPLPTYRLAELSALAAQWRPTEAISGLELVLYESAIMGNGAQANNPWLQELPDPISKVSWDNFIAVSPTDAERIGLKMDGDKTHILHLSVGAKVISLPAVIQPGQAKGTLSIALGYGRTAVGPVGNGLGYNAFADLSANTAGYWQTNAISVEIAKIGTPYTIARMQTHSTTMHRASIIQEASLRAYKKNPAAGRYHPKISTAKGKVAPEDLTLWDTHTYPNHHWGMVIDLNSCTGCSACVVACQAENNIPVVGREEVIRKRDMHWLRIDRYYKSRGMKGDKSLAGLAEAEQPADNPDVVFQPMLCQHCNHAPCETVCPVAATTHSSEGLNQMTYNRCVGTRYCANNCPYKVRRFNWFKYHDNDQFSANTAMNNALGKMALNPDVTVRARGVMEKCSFCVQRIQAGKLKAKQAKRPLREDDVEVACASACPTNAITFGDLKDKKSRISRQLALKTNAKGQVGVQEPRAYHVLEELNVRPNVWYLTKIRNKS